MREERVGAFLCRAEGGLGLAPQVCDAAGAHRETNKSRGRLEPERAEFCYISRIRCNMTNTIDFPRCAYAFRNSLIAEICGATVSLPMS